MAKKDNEYNNRQSDKNGAAPDDRDEPAIELTWPI